MARARWNGAVIAESDRFELVEGNVYFPPGTVRREHLGSQMRDDDRQGEESGRHQHLLERSGHADP